MDSVMKKSIFNEMCTTSYYINDNITLYLFCKERKKIILQINVRGGGHDSRVDFGLSI